MAAVQQYTKKIVAKFRADQGRSELYWKSLGVAHVIPMIKGHKSADP